MIARFLRRQTAGVSRAVSLFAPLASIALLTLGSSPVQAAPFAPTGLTVTVPSGSRNTALGRDGTSGLPFVDDVYLSTVTFGATVFTVTSDDATNEGIHAQQAVVRRTGVYAGTEINVNAEYGDQDTDDDGNANPFVKAGLVAEGGTAANDSTTYPYQDLAIRSAYNSYSLVEGTDGETDRFAYDLYFTKTVSDNNPAALDAVPELLFLERGRNSMLHVEAILAGGTLDNPILGDVQLLVDTNGTPSYATGIYIDTFEIGSGQQLGAMGVDLSDLFNVTPVQAIVGVRISAQTGDLGPDIYGVFGLADIPPVQFGPQDPAYTFSPSAIRLQEFRASRTQGGVALEWKTGHEVDNLGFNLYREDVGPDTRVNRNLIAGSALLARGVALQAGRSYTWWDPKPGGQYFLEDVDLNGHRTLHGPFYVTDGPASRQALQASPTLGELPQEAGEEPGVYEGPIRLATVPGRRVPRTRQASVQKGLAGGAAVKVQIRGEGWVKLTYKQLLAAGVNKRVDPRTFRLFADGVEVPLLVMGERDGRFQSRDTVEFYGRGLDTAFTDVRTYWLVSGSGAGGRVPQVRGSGTGEVPASFRSTVERKDRTIRFAALLNGETDNFFGPVVNSQSLNQTLTLSGVAAGASDPAQLQVVLQGVTALAGTEDHRVQVRLNGTVVGEVAFDGHENRSALFPVAAALLQDGANTVTLQALGGASDVSLVDTLRLTYTRAYQASGDSLVFTAPGGKAISVGGFTRSTVRVFDVTNPESPIEVLGKFRKKRREYTFTATVPGGLGQTRVLVAFRKDQLLAPVAVTANEPSALTQGSNGADLVILAHRDFRSSVTALKNLRQAQGLAVAVVDVEDVYDEFAFGHKSPHALRDFLAFTQQNWSKAPRFVLLVGDASYDPRNYLGRGYHDYLPTMTVATSTIETASDDWFTDWDGDGVGNLPTGRLPVRTAAAATAVISKIVGYDQGNKAEAWRKQVLLVGDADDAGYSFTEGVGILSSYLPNLLSSQQILRGESGGATRPQLLSALGGGQLIVNYLGHGTDDGWRGDVLTAGDAGRLGNGTRLPLFVSMTCLNGLFNDVFRDCLAEALVNTPNGGAVAAFTSSGTSLPTAQMELNLQFYGYLFAGQYTLGEAALAAKHDAGHPDVRKTWVLFGDPSMRIR